MRSSHKTRSARGEAPRGSGLSPTPADLGFREYLAALKSCRATVAFKYCPRALWLLCGLAAEASGSGKPIGDVARRAGIRSKTTQAQAIKLLVALQLVRVERVHGKGGEVRGTAWTLLSPPARMPEAARQLLKQMKIERDERSGKQLEKDLSGEG